MEDHLIFGTKSMAIQMNFLRELKRHLKNI